MMGAQKLKAKAEIPQREWLEIEVTLSPQQKIETLTWHAQGCNGLLLAAEKAAEHMKSKTLSKLDWPGTHHWDLLISEVILRLQGNFKFPLEDQELCHCRKIQAIKIDEAIVMGAHTPEKVKAWTTASSGCGTCRPEVEKLIQFRLKKK
jgi:NAD(P)H-nitrite reductase large subunit